MNPIARSWWRHRMESFSALLAICAGNSPASGEFPTQRPVTRSFDVFCDLCLNTRLRKQSWGWWFETLSRPLWRHRNGWVDATLFHNHASWRHLKSLPDLMQPQILATMWIYNYQNRNNKNNFLFNLILNHRIPGCANWYLVINYFTRRYCITVSWWRVFGKVRFRVDCIAYQGCRQTLSNYRTFFL